MSAFYNEIDAYPAQWMRNLIDAGHIAPGVVDERSIVDLEPKDLEGYEQAHFFAGIGVWSHALRLAGWADGDGVWTGSCPCQPFSAAGKRGGHRDERHLWPAWFRLIRECRPRVVFGEQVASKDGLAWLDAVRADMEGEGYAFGAADLCAAGVGAPHIRQRLFFVAHSEPVGKRQPGREGEQALRARANAERRRATGDMEHAAGDGRGERRTEPSGRRAAGRCGDGLVADAKRERGRGRASGIEDAADAGAPGEAGDIGQSDDARLEGRAGVREGRREPGRVGSDEAGRRAEAGATRGGFWSDAEWVWCRDGVWRPHGPESFPLTVAHGTTARVGRLRAYGNAIVAPLAAQFIASFMECWGRVVRP